MPVTIIWGTTNHTPTFVNQFLNLRQDHSKIPLRSRTVLGDGWHNHSALTGLYENTTSLLREETAAAKSRWHQTTPLTKIISFTIIASCTQSETFGESSALLVQRSVYTRSQNLGILRSDSICYMPNKNPISIRESEKLHVSCKFAWGLYIISADQRLLEPIMHKPPDTLQPCIV